ncbi:hypothetical protein ACFL0I_03690, partial [Gemmatimonadota bacterium]
VGYVPQPVPVGRIGRAFDSNPKNDNTDSGIRDLREPSQGEETMDDPNFIYIIASVLLGLVLLVACFLVAWKGKELTPAALTILRVGTAVGATFMAAGFLGFLELGGGWGEFTLKAGGPVVVFVLVYRFNPAEWTRQQFKK